MNKEEISYTITQTNFLVALAKYRYLTVPNIISLGIQKNEKAISTKIIVPLTKAEKPLIKKNEEIKSNPAEGKLHNIYSLTEEGAKTVAEYLRGGLVGIMTHF